MVTQRYQCPQDIDSRKLVVIINGEPESGKDSFCKWVGNIVYVMNVSSIDPIKKMATEYLEYDDNIKDEASRKLLSEMKRLSIEYNDTPYKYIESKIREFTRLDYMRSIMFIHIREPEEIEKVVNHIKSEYNGELSYLTLYITRDDRENHTDYGNDSDNNTDKFNYDLYYENKTTGNIADAVYGAISYAEENLIPRLGVYNYRWVTDPLYNGLL